MSEIDISGFLIFGLLMMVAMFGIAFTRSAKKDLNKKHIPNGSEFELSNLESGSGKQ